MKLNRMSDRHKTLGWMIRQRAQLLRDVRAWFDARQFCEVQVPSLSRECIVDLHIEPIAIASRQFGLSMDLPEHYVLQTSPEALMKRMLTDGAPSIYSIGPAFRSGERGREHNIEFTMLEWYELESGWREGVETLGQLATEMLGFESFDVACYRDVFQQHLGCDPLTAEVARLRQHLAQFDRELADTLSQDRDGLLETLWTFAIQPRIGQTRPIVIRNYPLSQAALAQTADDDPECAARFELFVRGVELANGYDELGDAAILEARFREANLQRKRLGRPSIPMPEQFLKAMRRGMPRCCGVALGFDRLLMIRTQSSQLDHVLPFPIETA